MLSFILPQIGNHAGSLQWAVWGQQRGWRAICFFYHEFKHFVSLITNVLSYPHPVLWHKRLGHPSAETLSRISSIGSIFFRIKLFLNILFVSWLKNIHYLFPLVIVSLLSLLNSFIQISGDLIINSLMITIFFTIVDDLLGIHGHTS